MKWPAIDFGHTPYEAAFARGDVYGIGADDARARKRALSVAIAGAGGVAQAKWLPAIRYLQTRGEPVTLVAVADPRPETAAKAAMLAQAEPFADVATMLDRARPDLLLVLAADPAHVPIADAAIAPTGLPHAVTSTTSTGM